MEYEYFRIDKSDPNLSLYAIKYRQLRLAALEQSPSSFSSTLEAEAAFSDEVWIARLSIPDKETFICVSKTGSSLVEKEWVGQVTIRGPLTASEYLLPSESGQPKLMFHGDEDKWQMLSLYTLPAHRGKGLGKALCREAFRHISSIKRSPSKFRVRIFAKPENTVTLRLYESLGFVHAGRCTLKEAMEANGEREFLPSEELSASYTTRTGYIMELEGSRG